jgi:holo-[acyl-carrier protein] synthase
MCSHFLATDIARWPGVVGIGTDLMAVSRIEDAYRSLGERFAKRILTEKELELWDQRSQSCNFLAKQFAAKEALSKALGTGIASGVTFQNMEVLRDEAGKPKVILSGKASERMIAIGGSAAFLSLSDDQGMILAFSVIASGVLS